MLRADTWASHIQTLEWKDERHQAASRESSLVGATLQVVTAALYLTEVSFQIEETSSVAWLDDEDSGARRTSVLP